MGVTTRELDKMLEQGQVYSDEVLPAFSKKLREFARQNDALTKAMNSNRNAMNNLRLEAEFAGDKVFTSGFGEGLTEFFVEVADLLKENETLWKSLGKVAGSVMKGLSVIIAALNPLLSAFGSILNSITSMLGDFSAAALLAFSPLTYTVIPAAVKALGGLSAALKAVFAGMVRVALPILAVVAALEEIAEFFNPTGKKTVIGMNITEFGQRGRDIKNMTDKALENGVKGYAVGRYGTPASPTQGYSYRTQRPETPTKVELRGDVILDNNKVGEVLFSTPEFEDSTFNAMGKLINP